MMLYKCHCKKNLFNRIQFLHTVDHAVFKAFILHLFINCKVKPHNFKGHPYCSKLYDWLSSMEHKRSLTMFKLIFSMNIKTTIKVVTWHVNYISSLLTSYNSLVWGKKEKKCNLFTDNLICHSNQVQFNSRLYIHIWHIRMCQATLHINDTQHQWFLIVS